MRIHSESVITHPQSEVYLAYRDRLPDVAPYFPDVEEIRVESRTEGEGTVTLHNVWVADREIPVFARAFIKPEMLQWDDHARWSDEERLVRWDIKLRMFTDSVTCSGTNTFEAASDDSTRVRIEGDLDIDLAEVPGVPRLLAKGIKPKLEKFIVSLVTPNLEQVNISLQKYLDDQQG